MKYLIILADGFADEPIKELDGLTPIMSAYTPNIDELCEHSVTGLLKTVPKGMHPGSEVANMSILGFDPGKYYQGRGVLEASAMDIDFNEDDLVFRCNLVSVKDEHLLNHSAGHISTEESRQLINTMNDHFANERIHFYSGVSYRHILILKGYLSTIECTPPHDIPGKPLKYHLPKSNTDKDLEKILRELMLSSKGILENHPVNIARLKEGKPVANMIWPWSGGHLPSMPSFKSLHSIRSGAVISAVDLIHGLGKMAGLHSIFVEGATGLYDTDYSEKTKAALKALNDHDFVYLHIEAADEAGHEGDPLLKKRIMEDIDSKVVGPILRNLKERNDLTVSLLPDHPTPCKLKTHTGKPVPFLMYKPDREPDMVRVFNEFSVKKGACGLIEGTSFMDLLLDK